jgi:hypothetical protein
VKLLRQLLRSVRRSATPKRTRPCRAPTVEPLEDRSLPSGLSFQFTLDDPGNQFAAYPLLRADLNAAGEILSSVLGGQGTILVLVKADNSIPRSEGAPLGTVFAGSQGGRAVYEPAALAAALTGVDPLGPGQPEIEIDLNTQSYLPQAWFDPSGAARTGTVPAGKTDFISIVLHEMTHGLGFTGWRAISGPSYGQLPAGFESAYDALTSFGAGGNPNVLYFTGPSAEAVYGGPVPLTSVGPSNPDTSQNFYHIGNPAGLPGTNLISDIMNGVAFHTGTRYSISPLDQAILADLGCPAHGWQPAPLPPLTGDVTGVVQVTLGRPHLDPRTHHYQGLVFLRNVGGQPIEGPLTLIVAPASRHAALRRGVRSVAQTIAIGELGPGATLTVVLSWGPQVPRGAIRVLAG